MKHLIDLKMADICFVEAIPFSLFESETVKAALTQLHPAYRPPTRKAIAGPLLEESYTQLQSKVSQIISGLPLLNIVTDESTNINNARIANISIHTQYGSFHYLSEDVGTKEMTAENTAIWLQSHLRILANGDLSRINSITTDTCATMLLMWKKLREMPELKHILCIPCDSHGLQLLVKDVLMDIPQFKILHEQAQSIAKGFKVAPLQYARLKAIQINRYGGPRALCLSVITRWGTQFRLFKSVLRSKEALRQFTYENDTVALAFDAASYINSTAFWVELEGMVELLEPIDTKLRMSESSKTHLGMVFDGWKNILSHLVRAKRSYPCLDGFLMQDGGFAKRYQRQVLPIHITAYYLTPTNITTPLDLQHEAKIYQIFQQYTDSVQEYQLLREEFLHYRNQLHPFTSDRPCWLDSNNPRIFWLQQLEYTQLIGKLATRIFSTPANSVASEHSFSIQNLTHNKSRNALYPERVNKLTYIHTNTRVLAQMNKKLKDTFMKSLYSLSDEEQVALENMLLEDEFPVTAKMNEDEMDIDEVMQLEVNGISAQQPVEVGLEKEQ